ncbi:hypothetical protein PM082_016640 [Marasmius tenuissimus]|nr:hypothetical protein PM082_016640 [Marasmius tenuissimus]
MMCRQLRPSRNRCSLYLLKTKSPGLTLTLRHALNAHHKMEFGPPFSPDTLERATTVARLRSLLYSTARYHLDDMKKLAEITKERDLLLLQIAELVEAKGAAGKDSETLALL